jgi:hypothetical protein
MLTIIAIMCGVLYYMYTRNKRENFSIENITENNIMPIYKDITAEAVVNYFGGAENFTKILLEHDIPMSYISDPEQYPKIATYLNLKMVKND